MQQKSSTMKIIHQHHDVHNRGEEKITAWTEKVKGPGGPPKSIQTKQSRAIHRWQPKNFDYSLGTYTEDGQFLVVIFDAETVERSKEFKGESHSRKRGTHLLLFKPRYVPSFCFWISFLLASPISFTNPYPERDIQ